jgi:hypothetical protein
MSIFENPKKVSKKAVFFDHCEHNRKKYKKKCVFFVTIIFLVFYKLLLAKTM